MNEVPRGSEALRVNLERTRAERIALPEEHQWLLGLCATHFGIHARLEGFLRELHHPYPNPAWLVDEYRNLALGDLWFYAQHPKAERALALLGDVFRIMFGHKLSIDLRERLAGTLLEFVTSAAQLGGPDRGELLRGCLDVLCAGIGSERMVMARFSGTLKTLGGALFGHATCGPALVDLLRRCLLANLELWAGQTDFAAWRSGLLSEVGEEAAALEAFLSPERRARLTEELERAVDWPSLTAQPDFNTLVQRFLSLPESIPDPFERARCLLRLLHHPGLAHMEPRLLNDLRRTFQSLQGQRGSQLPRAFVDTIFDEFGAQRRRNTPALLDCVLTLGKAVYDSGQASAREHFLHRVIALGFVAPSYAGINAEWQARVDPNHVTNIRAWLELITHDPAGSGTLIAALTENLELRGVFIADTDLFGRDVTRLLNAPIGPVYQWILELCRKFPVYYCEVGAEGELRDVATRLDELSQRQDRLLHFVRKQVHAESNSTHVELVRQVLDFWHGAGLGPLAARLPLDVQAWLPEGGAWIEGPRALVRAVCARRGFGPDALLALPPQELEAALAEIEPARPIDRQRVALLARLHLLLGHKYDLTAEGVLPHMRTVARRSNLVTQEEIDALARRLEAEDHEAALDIVFELMGRLRAVILDPRPSEAQEDIYYKRHVAAGIPSMYGTYFEPKFAALGLIFRLEGLASRLLEALVASLPLGYLSRKTLLRVAHLLDLFGRGLELGGLEHESFSAQLAMLHFSLKTTSFSQAQFVNLFQFLSHSLKQIIQNAFLRHHERSLPVVLGQRLEGTVDQATPTHAIDLQAEKFYRDLIAGSFLVQPLDAFLSRVLERLTCMCDNLGHEDLQRIAGFDLEALSSTIQAPSPELDNQVFLGSKGFFLKKMVEFGLPVPPGFILTTELFRIRECLARCPELSAEVTGAVRAAVRELERVTGHRLGDPARPLLLSVRSGAAISLPGAMNTFLNVGLNAEVAEGLSHQPNFGWTSWDCYRRSLQTWGMAHGMHRDVFDRLIMDFKRQFQVTEKVQFTPPQMRQIAEEYRSLLELEGIHFEEDLDRQLNLAIESVLASWQSERAQSYRRRLQIAEEWGTAVVVQSMVLGNIGYDSGTGVVFTHDPERPEAGIQLYGDFTTTSQGEDVVAGLVHPWPVSRWQSERTGIQAARSLETHFPEIYAALERMAIELAERRGLGPQEIEFTFESSRARDLYLLQTRDQLLPGGQVPPLFADPRLEAQVIGRGIGCGGGAMNGWVAFDETDLARLARERPGEHRILIRPDTVPDDIGLVFECDGLLTARGGVTSHAAVTASRLGKTCVVNCRVLQVFEEQKECSIQGERFLAGDPISIDGQLGNIYRGHHPIAEDAPVGNLEANHGL
jgi:pyruvate,orthophosphate dikinase